MELEQLSRFQGSLKRISKRNLEKLKLSILRNGFSAPIFVWRNGGANNILDGHQRLTALRSLEADGHAVPKLPVAYIEADSEQQAKAKLLAITSQYGDFVKEGLDEFLVDLDPSAILDTVRLVDRELRIGGQLGVPATKDDDEVPEPAEAITKPGDLWILGEHRLLCGDAGNAEDVDRLLAGISIQLVNTDPPYNVKVEPRSNNAIAAGLSSFSTMTHHQAFDLARHPNSARPTSRKLRAKDRPLENDFVSDEQFAQLLRSWFGQCARVLEPGKTFYIWGGYANCANYPGALADCGLYFSQAIIWVKEHPVLTRKDFMGNHEWCFYGWRKGGHRHYFDPEIKNATDVWPVKKVNPQSMVHLTEKPVELAVRAITYSSKPGENVLDLFGGSGSTLIGAEKTGRRAFLMEIDPLYCDVIVQRYREWCEKNGKKAEIRREGEGAAAPRRVHPRGPSLVGGPSRSGSRRSSPPTGASRPRSRSTGPSGLGRGCVTRPRPTPADLSRHSPPSRAARCGRAGT